MTASQNSLKADCFRDRFRKDSDATQYDDLIEYNAEIKLPEIELKLSFKIPSVKMKMT